MNYVIESYFVLVVSELRNRELLVFHFLQEMAITILKVLAKLRYVAGSFSECGEPCFKERRRRLVRCAVC